MLPTGSLRQRLEEIPSVTTIPMALLSAYTRFGLGGPADLLVDVSQATALPEACRLLRQSEAPWVVIGGGSNLLVADVGFRGVVVRYAANSIRREGAVTLAESGAAWQRVVDFHLDLGLAGMEKMTGIPGWLGGAVYGNAGAYGQTLMDFTESVEVFDGRGFQTISNAACGFVYRSSYFKQRKDWLITSARLKLPAGDAIAIREVSAEILATRNAKFPPTMKCAGSIFKNQVAERLPAAVIERVPPALIRGGKIPSAWFLEQVGAKGLTRGAIEVANYHANLIYNKGGGTAAEVCALIDELKARVRGEFGFDLEEEVQYLGFPDRASR